MHTPSRHHKHSYTCSLDRRSGIVNNPHNIYSITPSIRFMPSFVDKLKVHEPNAIGPRIFTHLQTPSPSLPSISPSPPTSSTIDTSSFVLVMLSIFILAFPSPEKLAADFVRASMYRCGIGSSGWSWRTLYGFGRSMRSKEGCAYGGGMFVSDKD